MRYVLGIKIYRKFKEVGELIESKIKKKVYIQLATTMLAIGLNIVFYLFISSKVGIPFKVSFEFEEPQGVILPLVLSILLITTIKVNESIRNILLRVCIVFAIVLLLLEFGLGIIEFVSRTNPTFFGYSKFVGFYWGLRIITPTDRWVRWVFIVQSVGATRRFSLWLGVFYLAFTILYWASCIMVFVFAYQIRKITVKSVEDKISMEETKMNGNIIKTIDVPKEVRKQSTLARVKFYDKFNLYSTKLVGIVDGKEETTWFFKDFATIKTVNANINSQFAQVVFVNAMNSHYKPTVISATTNLNIVDDVNKILFCSGMFSWSKASDFANKLHSQIIDTFNQFKENESNMAEANITSGTISIADEIKKFKELLDVGAITQEEFDRKKAELLK